MAGQTTEWEDFHLLASTCTSLSPEGEAGRAQEPNGEQGSQQLAAPPEPHSARLAHSAQLEVKGWCDLQVPFKDITFHQLIGKGSFKQVYRGRWKSVNVAIVAMRRGGLVVEARLLQRLGSHPNLLQFYRWSTDHRGNEYILVEFMPFGSLDKCLLSFGSSLRNRSKLLMCEQICHAMCELAREGVLHRDLAARNILVQSMQPVHVKVSDFGLARVAPAWGGSNSSSQAAGGPEPAAGGVQLGGAGGTGLPGQAAGQAQAMGPAAPGPAPGPEPGVEPGAAQVERHGGEEDPLVPVRWCAPEVLRSGSGWSEKSDVYSYGVCMWEIFMNGAEPYANRTDRQAALSIVRGEVLPRPKNCPQPVYRLMLDCWQPDPATRPSFAQVANVYRRWRESTLQARSAAAAAAAASAVTGVGPGPHPAAQRPLSRGSGHTAGPPPGASGLGAAGAAPAAAHAAGSGAGAGVALPPQQHRPLSPHPPLSPHAAPRQHAHRSGAQLPHAAEPLAAIQSGELLKLPFEGRPGRAAQPEGWCGSGAELRGRRPDGVPAAGPAGCGAVQQVEPGREQRQEALMQVRGLQEEEEAEDDDDEEEEDKQEQGHQVQPGGPGQGQQEQQQHAALATSPRGAAVDRDRSRCSLTSAGGMDAWVAAGTRAAAIVPPSLLLSPSARHHDSSGDGERQQQQQPSGQGGGTARGGGLEGGSGRGGADGDVGDVGEVRDAAAFALGGASSCGARVVSREVDDGTAAAAAAAVVSSISSDSALEGDASRGSRSSNSGRGRRASPRSLQRDASAAPAPAGRRGSEAPREGAAGGGGAVRSGEHGARALRGDSPVRAQGAAAGGGPEEAQPGSGAAGRRDATALHQAAAAAVGRPVLAHVPYRLVAHLRDEGSDAATTCSLEADAAQPASETHGSVPLRHARAGRASTSPPAPPVPQGSAVRRAAAEGGAAGVGGDACVAAATLTVHTRGAAATLPPHAALSAAAPLPSIAAHSGAVTPLPAASAAATPSPYGSSALSPMVGPRDDEEDLVGFSSGSSNGLLPIPQAYAHVRSPSHGAPMPLHRTSAASTGGSNGRGAGASRGLGSSSQPALDGMEPGRLGRGRSGLMGSAAAAMLMMNSTMCETCVLSMEVETAIDPLISCSTMASTAVAASAIAAAAAANASNPFPARAGAGIATLSTGSNVQGASGAVQRLSGSSLRAFLPPFERPSIGMPAAAAGGVGVGGSMWAAPQSGSGMAGPAAAPHRLARQVTSEAELVSPSRPDVDDAASDITFGPTGRAGFNPVLLPAPQASPVGAAPANASSAAALSPFLAEGPPAAFPAATAPLAWAPRAASNPSAQPLTYISEAALPSRQQQHERTLEGPLGPAGRTPAAAFGSQHAAPRTSLLAAQHAASGGAPALPSGAGSVPSLNSGVQRPSGAAANPYMTIGSLLYGNGDDGE